MANTNRLSNEKSPYLLQHAHNPVDWFPWGEEAFEKARKENKPVFVSIGYSTCHWCHVMEKESFEDEEVAELLNKHFISIKVDREERPDIDSLYMNVCQMLTGQGGWPLNVFLTPDQKPFFAGTYYPKEAKYGRPGMMELIPQLYNAFSTNTKKMNDLSLKLTNALHKSSHAEAGSLSPKITEAAFQQLRSMYDAENGGFGGAPKFPTPGQLLFLLRYYETKKDPEALNMVETTLDSIARGGIYDHIGYGFARYSTDPMWLVPHFEKMLYDQALLLIAYSEAYQITKIPQYQEIVYNTIEFVERELTHPEGGFYSAIDADSEGEEGAYYIWSYKEVMELLGEEEGALFTKAYDITEEGNFEGRNIPNLIFAEADPLLEEFHLSLDELEERLEASRIILFERRQSRVYPHLDDKILTAWNGLMVVALTKAGAVFKEPKFIEKAEKALSFINLYLKNSDILYARFRDGEAKHIAYLDDYAFLLWSYIELYEATGNTSYLEKAEQTAALIFQNFEDKENGGFYFTQHDAEKLFVREKITLDSAIPSGNGIATLQLWRLAKLTEDLDLMRSVEKLLAIFADDINTYPSSTLTLLSTELALHAEGREIKIVGSDTESVLNLLNTTFRPYDVWTHKHSLEKQIEVEVCQNNVCQLAMSDIGQIFGELTK